VFGKMHYFASLYVNVIQVESPYCLISDLDEQSPF